MDIFYLIRIYNLPKGEVLYTHEAVNFIFVSKIEEDSRREIISIKGTTLNGIERIYKPLSSIYYISRVPKGLEYKNNSLLPYTATIIEDLPAYCNFEPQRYENCVLMAELHGGYLQFYYPETKEVLRIALNCHYIEIE